MKEKKKMSDEQKAKLIYSGELLLFVVVFLVFAVLMALGVLCKTKTKHLIYNIITLAGGVWQIVDFIWAVCSKKRQKRIAMIDKFLTLPLGIMLIVFDLYCFINGDYMLNGPTGVISGSSETVTYAYQIGLPVIFVYIAIIYAFEAFYHYKHPIPGLLDEINIENKEQKQSESFAQNDETVNPNNEDKKE